MFAIGAAARERGVFGDHRSMPLAATAAPASLKTAQHTGHRVAAPRLAPVGRLADAVRQC
jgi:hypothetical protein